MKQKTYFFLKNYYYRCRAQKLPEVNFNDKIRECHVFTNI